MEVIDQILNEWSFRCHDGIVDLNNHDKVLILKELLDKENNENLDIFLEANMSPLADEAIQFIKDKYNFTDNNFKATSKSSFKILLPNDFKKSRTEVMTDLEQNPDFKFDQGSIGSGSSIGRLKYKDKVIVFVKFEKGQGGQSAGKSNESAFFNLINSHIAKVNKPITVILKSNTKEIITKNVAHCKDSAHLEANDYSKADVQLVDSNNTVVENISLKKRNAVRWESSKRRLNDLFNKFIEKTNTENPQFSEVILQPIPETSNKFKLFNPKTNKILSKVIITNIPPELNNEFVFGKDDPKIIVVKEDFERYNNYIFDEDSLTLILNVYQIYTDIEDIMGTQDEPVLAFSNHINKQYGIELRAFSKDLLYKDQELKGSSVEIDYNNI